MSNSFFTVPDGWSVSTVGDLGDWSGGQTPLKSNGAFWKDGTILWLSPKDINGPAVRDSEDKITDTALAKTRLRRYSPQSIIIVVRSGILKHTFPVARSNRPFTVNQDLKVLEASVDSDSGFAFFTLTHLEQQVLRKVVKAGTTVESVDMPTLLKFPISKPSLPEQRKIARILTTVDNLIEQTEALIEKYKSIKRGMMHDLFTRGVDESGKLRPPYEAAPQLYKESPLGWIPKEWEVSSVGDDLIAIDAGKSPNCPDQPAPHGEWGVLKVSAVQPDGFRSDENKVIQNRMSEVPHVLWARVWVR